MGAKRKRRVRRNPALRWLRVRGSRHYHAKADDGMWFIEPWGRDWRLTLVRPAPKKSVVVGIYPSASAAKTRAEVTKVVANPRRRPARRQRTTRRRANPPAGQFATAKEIGRTTKPTVFYYRHKSDGKLYRHKTGKGMILSGVVDGSLRLASPDGKPLWGNY